MEKILKTNTVLHKNFIKQGDQNNKLELFHNI